MKKSILSLFSILLLTFILLLVNGISSLSFGRFKVDLTEEKLFSLSQGTKNILSNLEDNITLRYYSSRPEDIHPGIKIYAKRIEDLLREYKRYAGEKLTLEIYDPEPDTDAEDWAKKYGLKPFSLPGKTPIFLGLVGINGFAEEDVIPFFQPDRQNFLEYDLTKLIYNLERAKKPKVGLISSVKVAGENASAQAVVPGQIPQQTPAWFFLKQLEALADVEILDPELSEIDPSVSLLMIIHPPELSEQTLYAIDQFVVRGGNLFIAIDPNCQSCVPSQQLQQTEDQGGPSAESNLNSLLEKWGVTTVSKKVVGNRDLAAKVGVSQGQVAEFLLWLAFSNSTNEQVINSNDIVTNQLDSIIMPWAGSLELNDVEGLTSEALLKTTDNSKLYDNSVFNTINSNPEFLLKNFSSEDKSHVIAARLSGKFKSTFSEAPEKSDISLIRQSENQSNIIVVSDVDFIADQFSIAKQRFFNTEIVSLLNDNILFLQNAIENLLGSNDLISLRSRGTFSRPFSLVEKIEREAQERWLDEEQALQDELNAINTRLGQLQSVQGEDSSKKAIVNQAVLDEIQNFREQQKQARKRLREVRRSSREDIEILESKLFFINTFLVPLFLILFVVILNQVKNRKKFR